MIFKNLLEFSKKIFLINTKNTYKHFIQLSKEIYHRIPISYYWKKRGRILIREILTFSFFNRNKSFLRFNMNYSRQNIINYLHMCAQRIRIRRELSRRKNRTLIFLICRKGSIDGLEETLEDLFYCNNNMHLIVLSDIDLNLDGNRNLPPFEKIEELQIESLSHYAKDYSYFIVFQNGDRIKEFSLEYLLFHMDPSDEIIGIYSDYRVGDTIYPLPDWDPVLIQYENYITAPVLFKVPQTIQILKSSEGIELDKLKSFEDWEEWLLMLLKVLPPRSLAHFSEPLFALMKSSTNFRSGSRNFQNIFFSLSIIIPTNGKKLSVLKRCLHSLMTITKYISPIEIILLDNSRGQLNSHYYDYLKELITKNIRVITYDFPFNWSAINNFGATIASGEILLFLNDDTEVISPDWVIKLLDPFNFPWVGVVAPRLIYPDGTIQHAGATLLPYGGGAANIGLGAKEIPGSLWNRSPRSVLTVMGACIATRRKIFQHLGGFDERYRIVLSETAYCLSVGENGYQVVYTPLTTIIHHERMSRKGVDPPEDESLFWKEWAHKIMAPDPYYPEVYEKNPNSVKFELSERKMAITILSPPYIYSDEIKNILVLKPPSSENDLFLADLSANLREQFPSAFIFLVYEPSEQEDWKGKIYADKTENIDLFLGQKGTVSDILKINNEIFQEFDIAIGFGKHPKIIKALEQSKAILNIMFNPVRKDIEMSSLIQGKLSFLDQRLGQGIIHIGQEPDLLKITQAISSLHCRTFQPQKISPITIGIATGACSEENKWPVRYYEQMTTIFLRLGFHVLLFGKAEDIFLNLALQTKLEKEFPDRILNLTGKIKLSDYQKTIEEKCVLYIGNNSELTRLVANSGIPTIAILREDFDLFEWFSAGENLTVIFRDVPNPPCHSRVISSNRKCFEDLHPEDVLPSVWRILAVSLGRK